MHGYGGVGATFLRKLRSADNRRTHELSSNSKPRRLITSISGIAWVPTGIVFAMPHILGADGAGVVAESRARRLKTSNWVTRSVSIRRPDAASASFARTERDFMCIRLRVLGERLEGTYAQYVKLPGENCFRHSDRFSFREAAAFPLVFVTLWRMVITNAALKPGETMLIIGVGGGVASAALQVAKNRRARRSSPRQRC